MDLFRSHVQPEGMQCKAQRAAQAGRLRKRYNAAMRPSGSNPPGSRGNRLPAVLLLLAVAPYAASSRLACSRFSQLHDS